jgi:hypothetical protein
MKKKNIFQLGCINKEKKIYTNVIELIFYHSIDEKDKSRRSKENNFIFSLDLEKGGRRQRRQDEKMSEA